VEFNCSAQGVPKPTFKFFKNGKGFPPLLNVDVSNKSFENNAEIGQTEKIRIFGSTLLIKDVKKTTDKEAGDNGVYQCLASNMHGTLWSNFYLNLLCNLSETHSGLTKN